MIDEQENTISTARFIAIAFIVSFIASLAISLISLKVNEDEADMFPGYGESSLKDCGNYNIDDYKYSRAPVKCEQEYKKYQPVTDVLNDAEAQNEAKIRAAYEAYKNE